MTISVAEAARHLADCIERARGENSMFILMENGTPVARLVPEAGRRCTGRDLAAAMAKTSLSPNEGRAWHEDSPAARETLRPSVANAS